MTTPVLLLGVLLVQVVTLVTVLLVGTAILRELKE